MKKFILAAVLSLTVICLTAATHIRGMYVDCGNGLVWEVWFNQDVSLEVCDAIAIELIDNHCDL